MVFSKPPAVASALYVPTGRRRRLSDLLSFVCAFHVTPRSVSVATTVAPLIGAPLGSTTVPTMAAVTSWQLAGVRFPPTNTRANRARSTKVSFFITASSEPCEPHQANRAVIQLEYAI